MINSTITVQFLCFSVALFWSCSFLQENKDFFGLPLNPKLRQSAVNVKCKCNLFTHEAPRSSQALFQKCPCIPGSNWNLELFLRRGENRTTRRKTSRSRVENKQITQPIYDAGSGNRTKATLVGGERSQHCTNPAP